MACEDETERLAFPGPKIIKRASPVKDLKINDLKFAVGAGLAFELG
jgi:hypothetical protein